MTRWLSDAAIRRLRSGDELPDLGTGRYRLVEPIGTGGMGTVFCAEDTELRRDVAVKIIRPELSTPAATERMLSEARITARLEHPGVLPVHDVGSMPDGRLYYVMKLARGQRLDEHLDRGTTLRDRLNIFERICDTVAFAHAHGVIHRDLKPQNIMLGSFGEVLVVDWGIAKRLTVESPADHDREAMDSREAMVSERAHDTRTMVTAGGARVGTPAYMAPEQAASADAVDRRSDVYALGGLLYFLIAGQAPHDASAIEQMDRGRPPAIRPPRDVAPGIPRQLASICTRALQPDPARRYESAEALQSDVRRFLASESVRAHREGILERLIRVLRKYRTPVLLVLTYLVVRSLLLFLERR